MHIKFGEGRTQYGPGVAIDLTGDEVALAIMAWLVGQNVHTSGPITVTVNGKLCDRGQIYVDPSGSVNYHNKMTLTGRGEVIE